MDLATLQAQLPQLEALCEQLYTAQVCDLDRSLRLRSCTHAAHPR